MRIGVYFFRNFWVVFFYFWYKLSVLWKIRDIFEFFFKINIGDTVDMIIREENDF